eukprot:symbB.v1.2.031017.t1/scaffold3556.1/size54161/2
MECLSQKHLELLPWQGLPCVELEVPAVKSNQHVSSVALYTLLTPFFAADAGTNAEVLQALPEQGQIEDLTLDLYSDQPMFLVQKDADGRPWCKQLFIATGIEKNVIFCGGPPSAAVIRVMTSGTSPSIEDLLKKSQSEVAKAILEEVQGRVPSLSPIVLRIQRLPTGSNAPHSNYAYDLVLPYLLAYLVAGKQADISVSADPFVAFPMANFLMSKGFKVVRETEEALKKRSTSPALILSARSQTKEEVLAWFNNAGEARSKL